MWYWFSGDYEPGSLLFESFYHVLCGTGTLVTMNLVSCGTLVSLCLLASITLPSKLLVWLNPTVISRYKFSIENGNLVVVTHCL